MKVKHFAALREVAKKAEEILTLPKNATVWNVLDELVSRYGTRYASTVLDERSSIQNGIMVLLNGRAVPHTDVKKVGLESGDVVTFLPPVAGG